MSDYSEIAMNMSSKQLAAVQAQRVQNNGYGEMLEEEHGKKGVITPNIDKKSLIETARAKYINKDIPVETPPSTTHLSNVDAFMRMSLSGERAPGVLKKKRELQHPSQCKDKIEKLLKEAGIDYLSDDIVQPPDLQDLGSTQRRTSDIRSLRLARPLLECESEGMWPNIYTGVDRPNMETKETLNKK
ncbi:uncharacterized protein LOC119662138 [Teleopsis dalmanni]|uniref:uncharacterized protein LOC119662129 n=1 Tax=Teleopsis dalmanni TaxID=139649 RepID=UPI0018CCC6C6|nr:uncharacterized protein LOC119662129 [Teleopsis dalmanni]XP_037927615.1 uncharacterized protein LOC119662129 [Teleopsis dalmanni]XP_037927622.1 uncharacterized protein LOC119662138 [Teleopsis dalmanni]